MLRYKGPTVRGTFYGKLFIKYQPEREGGRNTTPLTTSTDTDQLPDGRRGNWVITLRSGVPGGPGGRGVSAMFKYQ